jgi:hypothetical protein
MGLRHGFARVAVVAVCTALTSLGMPAARAVADDASVLWHDLAQCVRDHGYPVLDPTVSISGTPTWPTPDDETRFRNAVNALGSKCASQLAAALAAQKAAARSAATAPSVTNTAQNPSTHGTTVMFRATPLEVLGTHRYKGFKGGLYPGGRNKVPAAQDKVGRQRVLQVRPVDRTGQPAANGKIVLLSIGMSNAAAEWCGATTCASTEPSGESFMNQAARSQAVDHQAVVIVNGAKSGQVASFWESSRSPDYDQVRDQQLAPLGLTEAQVQVVWLKEADSDPKSALPSPTADAYNLETALGNIVRALKIRYPNLRQVFLSSRIYAGYATSTLNPEPYAYESGFAVKWLIQAQINQLRHASIADRYAGDVSEGTAAPWLAWGPYLWADGTHARTDGLRWQPGDFESDGTHPSASGIAKVGAALLHFFLTSPYTRCWFRSSSQHAQCAP